MPNDKEILDIISYLSKGLAFSKGLSVISNPRYSPQEKITKIMQLGFEELLKHNLIQLAKEEIKQQEQKNDRK